jgi:outer membrane protein OmpA-like peptidoglycan-associated protein
MDFTTMGENMSASSAAAVADAKRKRRKKQLTNPQMSFGMAAGAGIMEKPKRPGAIGISSPSEDERMMRSLVQQSLNVETSIRNGNEGNKEVTFTVHRVSGPKVAKWMLAITDAADKQVVSLTGDGMPDTINWNGKNKAGKPAKNIYELSYDLVLVDINNSQESTTGMFEQSAGTGGVVSSSSAPTAGGLSPNAIVSGARGGNQTEELKKDKKIGVIYFEQGRAEITNDASEKIGTAVDQMKKYPKTKILVEGYCDPMDEKADALALSKSRADAVTRYMTAYYKISVGRILVRPKGDKQPVVKSEDERLRDKNRRVEITLQAGN